MGCDAVLDVTSVHELTLFAVGTGPLLCVSLTPGVELEYQTSLQQALGHPVTVDARCVSGFGARRLQQQTYEFPVLLTVTAFDMRESVSAQLPTSVDATTSTLGDSEFIQDLVEGADGTPQFQVGGSVVPQSFSTVSNTCHSTCATCAHPASDGCLTCAGSGAVLAAAAPSTCSVSSGGSGGGGGGGGPSSSLSAGDIVLIVIAACMALTAVTAAVVFVVLRFSRTRNIVVRNPVHAHKAKASQETFVTVNPSWSSMRGQGGAAQKASRWTRSDKPSVQAALASHRVLSQPLHPRVPLAPGAARSSGRPQASLMAFRANPVQRWQASAQGAQHTPQAAHALRAGTRARAQAIWAGSRIGSPRVAVSPVPCRRVVEDPRPSAGAATPPPLHVPTSATRQTLQVSRFDPVRPPLPLKPRGAHSTPLRRR